MGTLVYEFKRTVSSKTVIILTIVVIAISFFNAVNSASSSPGPIYSSNSIGYGYGSNGTYTIVTHVLNGYGVPLQDSKVFVSLGNSNFLTAHTNSQGYANFTLTNVNSSFVGNPQGFNTWGLVFNYTNAQGSVGYGPISMYSNYSDPYFFKAIYETSKVGGAIINVTTNVSRYRMSSENVLNHPIEHSLRIFYEGPVNVTSRPVELFYLPVNGSRTPHGTSVDYPVVNLTEKNMTYLGAYSGFTNINVNVHNLSGSNISYYYFALFTQGGKSLGSIGFYIETPGTPYQVTQQFYGTQMSIMGLFIPLMAAVSAYATYGKDRINGVLESVLARPVSRKGLIFSRYLANLLAVFAATLAAFIISSLSYNYYLGHLIAEITFISGLWSLFVVSAAYIGLVFLASNFFRSQGALLGFSIGIFLVFDFFWAFAGADFIPLLVSSVLLKLPVGGTAYLQSFVDLYYISPAGMPDITSLIITGSSYYTISVQSYQLVRFGLTYFNVLLVGILWSVIPFAMSVLSFVKKG